MPGSILRAGIEGAIFIETNVVDGQMGRSGAEEPRRRRMLSVIAPTLCVDVARCWQSQESNRCCLCPSVFGAITLWRMDPDRRMGMLAAPGI
jgi:hypothetical protein